MRFVTRTTTSFIVTLVLTVGLVPALAQDDQPESAKTWIGRAAEIEAFMRTADTSNIEEIGVGVTNPKFADLEPGGPIDRIVFKPLAPGIYQGFWESYKSEIAAYELDKLLELGMIPPIVEKRVQGDLGAAIMLVGPQQSFKDFGGPPTPPNLYIGRFDWELICAKMFHNLIYNRDPNLGNWLVDPAWNLILIDNSRAFTTDTDERVHKLTRIDRDLWDRFVALDEATLTSALGDWLGDDEIRAILERRDEMAKDIEEMVEDRGENAVFVRFRPTPPSVTPPAASAGAPAPGSLDALAGQLVGAINEAPVVLPGSELTWIGRIVRLADYDGPYRSVAVAGADSGHALGIVTELDGLLCLTRDGDSPEHYDRLLDLEGLQAEVFGLISERAGMTIVRVTLSATCSSDSAVMDAVS